MTRKTALFFIFIFIVSLSGCGWWKDVREWWHPQNMARGTPEGLYKRGAEQYQDGRYKKAIESFQRLKEQYPLHPMAVVSELGIADSYFSDENYIEAEMAYSDFINLHPTNENLPYAMYQLGMCHYNQMTTVDRDLTEAVKAKKAFEQMIARFPSSKFSFMAEKNLLETRRRLAEKEFYVGNFYFTQAKYKAALGRFEAIAKEYPNVGLDYKVAYFIEESKKRLVVQEAAEKVKKEKEEQAAKAKEEKEARAKAAKEAKALKEGKTLPADAARKAVDATHAPESTPAPASTKPANEMNPPTEKNKSK